MKPTYGAIILLFTLVGCAVHATSDPVQINHTVSLDLDKVDAYFQVICAANYLTTDPSYLQKVSKCKYDMISGLLSMAGHNGT